jgi:hypothetical protein
MTAVSQGLSVIEPCNWPQNAALAVFAVASGVKGSELLLPHPG